MGMLRTCHGARRPPGSFTAVVFPHLSSAFIPALGCLGLGGRSSGRDVAGSGILLDANVEERVPVGHFGLVLHFRKYLRKGGGVCILT